MPYLIEGVDRKTGEQVEPFEVIAADADNATAIATERFGVKVSKVTTHYRSSTGLDAKPETGKAGPVRGLLIGGGIAAAVGFIGVIASTMSRMPAGDRIAQTVGAAAVLVAGVVLIAAAFIVGANRGNRSDGSR